MTIRKIFAVAALLLFALTLAAFKKQDCRFTIENKTDTRMFINVDGTQESLFGYKDGHDHCSLEPGQTCAFTENASCHTLHAVADGEFAGVPVAHKKVSDCGLDKYTWTINQGDIRW